LFGDLIRMGVNINETWRDDQVSRVNLLAGCFRNSTDPGHAPLFYTDIGMESRIARAIHDAPAADDNIESLGPRGAARTQDSDYDQEQFHRAHSYQPTKPRAKAEMDLMAGRQSGWRSRRAVDL
jgi:hypothetical protein